MKPSVLTTRRDVSVVRVAPRPTCGRGGALGPSDIGILQIVRAHCPRVVGSSAYVVYGSDVCSSIANTSAPPDEPFYSHYLSRFVPSSYKSLESLRVPRSHPPTTFVLKGAWLSRSLQTRKPTSDLNVGLTHDACASSRGSGHRARVPCVDTGACHASLHTTRRNFMIAMDPTDRYDMLRPKVLSCAEMPESVKELKSEVNATH